MSIGPEWAHGAGLMRVLGATSYCMSHIVIGVLGSAAILDHVITGPEASLAIGWVIVLGSGPAAIALGVLSISTFHWFLAAKSVRRESGSSC